MRDEVLVMKIHVTGDRGWIPARPATAVESKIGPSPTRERGHRHGEEPPTQIGQCAAAE